MGQRDPVYHLSIGADLARKDKDAAVVLDTITDTATAETIASAAPGTQPKAGEGAARARESHTSVESHRVELQVIRALHDAGRHVTIAPRCFPTPARLVSTAERRLNEEEFLTRSHWYDAWG